MPLRKPSDDYNRVGGSRRFARDFNKLNREVARQSDVSLPIGGTNGVDGVTQGAEPARLLVKITAKDGSTPPKYSWTAQLEANATLGDDTVGFAGTDTNFWAYELNGSDVPIGTIVELRPGHGGEYFWFSYTGASSSSSISIYDGTTSQTIAAGDTITFTGGEGVDLTVSATDTVTADLDFIGLTQLAGADRDYTNDYICVYDGSVSEHKKYLMSELNTFTINNGGYSPYPVFTTSTLHIITDGTLNFAAVGTPVGCPLSLPTVTNAGGDSTVTIGFDLSRVDNETPTTSDNLLFYDVSAVSTYKHRKCTINDIIGLVPTPSDSTITITDGTTSQDVVSGDTITFTSGTGVDLTVSATDTVTADLDIAGLSTITFNSAEDYVPVLDGTDSSIKRALLPSYSFTLTGDSGSQTISGSDTMTIAGSNGILTTVAATDTCTVSINIPGLTEETTIEAGDYFLLYDASVAANRKYPASSIPTPSTGGPANASYLSEYTDWSIAATTNTVTLATFSAKTHVDKVLIRRKTAQSGVTEVTFTLTLESTGEASSSYSPINPLDASDSAHNVALTDYCGSYTNTTALKLTVNSSGGNLSSLTAGAIEVWAFYRTLPVPT